MGWNRWKWVARCHGVATKFIILISLRVERMKKIRCSFEVWRNQCIILDRALEKAQNRVSEILKRCVRVLGLLTGRVCRSAVARWRAVVAMQLVQFAGARVNAQRSATLVIRFYRKIPGQMLRRAWLRWIDHDRCILSLKIYRIHLRGRLASLRRSLRIGRLSRIRRAAFYWRNEARARTKTEEQARITQVNAEIARARVNEAAVAAREKAELIHNATVEKAELIHNATVAKNAALKANRVAGGIGILHRFDKTRFYYFKLARPRFMAWRKTARVMKLASAIADVRLTLSTQEESAIRPPPVAHTVPAHTATKTVAALFTPNPEEKPPSAHFRGAPESLKISSAESTIWHTEHFSESLAASIESGLASCPLSLTPLP